MFRFPISTILRVKLTWPSLSVRLNCPYLDLGSPPVRFVWLSIGSQGRKEQLLPTDQDSILIFEDVTANKYRDVKDYFLKLGKRTTSTLEKVGYELCPNGRNGKQYALV